MSSPPVKAGVRAVSSNAVAAQAKPETVSATSVKTWESTFRGSSPPVKAGVRAVSSNAVAGQAKPETVSATPVKAWESTEGRVGS